MNSDEKQKEYKRSRRHLWDRWCQSDVEDFIKYLSEKLKPKYHVGLFGSSLIFEEKNERKGDLDILIIPHNSNEHNIEEVHTILREQVGLINVSTAISVRRAWQKFGSNDKKVCEVWALDRRPYFPKKVDIFYPYADAELLNYKKILNNE